MLKLLYFEPCLNSLCFFSSLSHCCCHDVPCAQNFSVEEIRVFQTCLVENPSVKVVYFENHAEWRFCFAPFVCRALLARWRLVGVVALGWRSGARACCPFLVCFSSVCTCALPLNIHLDSCDRTQAISLKSHIHCTTFNTVMSPTFLCVNGGC